MHLVLIKLLNLFTGRWLNKKLYERSVRVEEVCSSSSLPYYNLRASLNLSLLNTGIKHYESSCSWPTKSRTIMKADGVVLLMVMLCLVSLGIVLRSLSSCDRALQKHSLFHQILCLFYIPVKRRVSSIKNTRRYDEMWTSFCVFAYLLICKTLS